MLKKPEDERLLALLVELGNVERSAGCGTNFLARKGLVGSGEVRDRIEFLVLVKIPRVAVEGVGAGLGDHVDDVARAPSILGSEGVVLDLELLDRVNRGNKNNAAPLGIGIP